MHKSQNAEAGIDDESKLQTSLLAKIVVAHAANDQRRWACALCIAVRVQSLCGPRAPPARKRGNSYFCERADDGSRTAYQIVIAAALHAHTKWCMGFRTLGKSRPCRARSALTTSSLTSRTLTTARPALVNGGRARRRVWRTLCALRATCSSRPASTTVPLPRVPR